ncbi:hypothetical protein QL285_013326 [Trifolium repens]|nr:hypothetical protein QL285_013326 [Trifolium repens]
MSHIRKAPIRKIIQPPLPLNLRSTERTPKKPPNLGKRTDSRSRIKSDRPTRLQDQNIRAPLTPVNQRNTIVNQIRLQLDTNTDLEAKLTGPNQLFMNYIMSCG